MTARATPGAFGAQAAGATRRAAQREGKAEEQVSEARRREGIGEIGVARARSFAARQTSRSAADLGDALAGAGDAGFRIYAALQERERRDQDIETERLVGVHGSTMEARAATLQEGAAPDGDGYSDSVTAEFDKSAAKMLEGAKSNYQRRTMERALARQRVQVERSANRWEIAERARKRRSDLEGVIQQTEAKAAKQPAAVQQHLAEVYTAIDRSNIRPSEKAKAKRQADRRFTKIAVGSLLANGDAESLEDAALLLDNEKVQLALGGDIVTAKKQLETAYDVNGKREDRQRRILAEETYKEGQEMLTDNQLTEEWLNANQGVLTGTQFSVLSGALRQENRRTDVATYARLVQRVDTDPKAAKDEAVRAFQQGLITKPDLNSIRNAAHQQERNASIEARREGKPRVAGYTEIKQFIRRKINPTGSVIPDYGGLKNRAAADAEMEFVEWAHENNNATFDQAKTKADELVKQATLKEGATGSGGALVKPFGYSGSAKEMTKKDLLESKRLIAEQGKSRGEDWFHTQVRIWRIWNDRVEAMNAE